MKSFDEIMKSLFYNKVAWYVDMFGKVKSNKTTLYMDRNNCTSQEHIEKWLCINDLINISKGLNGDWEVDWSDLNQVKFCLEVKRNGQIMPIKVTDIKFSFVYFKSEDVANNAISIIGTKKLEVIFS